jgi:hypothetical protein
VTTTTTSDAVRALKRLLAGVPDDQPAPTWVDAALEHSRRSDEAIAEQEAHRQAQAQAEADRQKSISQLLAEAITGAANTSDGTPHLALNAAGLLRRALAGGGTVNGEPTT